VPTHTVVLCAIVRVTDDCSPIVRREDDFARRPDDRRKIVRREDDFVRRPDDRRKIVR
jgi:hypothetical protein